MFGVLLLSGSASITASPTSGRFLLLQEVLTDLRDCSNFTGYLLCVGLGIWAPQPLPQTQGAGMGMVGCQKRGVAYPRLPYLRRGETMLFDVRVPLVIRSEVTTNG